MLRLRAQLVVLLSLGMLSLGAMADPGQTPVPHKAVHRKATAKSKRAKAVAKAEAEKEPPKPVEIPPMTPEQLPAQAPLVSYQNGLLKVDSENSTLRDVLTAIRKQASVQMDVPVGMGGERVVVHLAGTGRQVITSLLDGTSWDYIILSWPGESEHVQKLIITSAGGGVASSLAKGVVPGASKAGSIPGGPGTEASDEPQPEDTADQPPPEDTPDQPDQDQPPPQEEQPQPQSQNFPPPPPPNAQGVAGNNQQGQPPNINQPQSIDQFNQNMRRGMQRP